MEIIVLTRRAFTGGIGCSVLGLVELAGTGAAAQERSPAVARVSGKGPKIDPRIRRLLRSRTPLDLDIARGLVKAGPATSSGASQFTIPTLALFRSDAIPGNLRHHKWDRIAGQIYAADLLRDDFQQLESDPDVLYVEGGQAVRPTIDTSRTEIRAKEVQAPQGGGSGQASGLTGEGVIVGIIDGGLDFTLDDFRDEKGNTRILFLWDQDLTRQGTEQPPAGFDFGVEYTASHIRDELARHPIAPWSVVRHKPKKADHGTHVAGIAVGNGRSHDEMFPIGQYAGIAPRADIIFVSGASTKNDNTADLARAVKYIFQKADELGKPCVINISLGSGGGSHDGQSLVERAFDDMLLQKPGRAIVKAAGNQHGTSTHFSDVLKAGVQQLIWRVHANDRSENEIEIWFSSQDRVRTRLKGPGGIATPWVAPDNHIEGDWGAVHINIMSDSATALNGDALIFIEVKPLGGDIPAGDWFIELEVQNPKAGRFHVWIERDDAKAENQSYFVKPNGERVSGGKTTLSFPGTGIRTIAVANYQHLKVPVEVAGSSGRGPTRDGRRKPEVAAPGTAIVASCALGGRPDGHGGKYPMRVAKSGTSMAAPHVAGAIALILQRHPTLTAWDIRTALIKSARRMPQEDDFTPSWGHGRLDIVACLEALEP